jgi:hypothetical protein
MTVWDELTLNEVQSILHNWMTHPAWVIENGESLLLKKYETISSDGVNLKIGGGVGNCLYTPYINL